MLCRTPPRMALHRSSVVVSGWTLPRYTVRFMAWPPVVSTPKGVNGLNGLVNGFALVGETADCAISDCAAATWADCAAACWLFGMYAHRSLP
jgi:hypothetical protein